ncbi:hypothetical protein RM533_05760 [Croceicoccus sp. F390]|uniref:Uncharacterized protein n=1 Tax=Croceicoccus esteveae TaxID=3075597 RepID=A0ABU2ZH30_9SPHN|nr:hypothetical protein [Croceicoccus sp. F390]MDT0575685.1 hypothetical protein [Croceicoccus sp. F390]
MLTAIAVLAGCSSEGELVLNEGVGVNAVRSRCPAVGIAEPTGDITLFRDSANPTQASLDVTATMTNVRSSCDDSGARIYAEVAFDIHARRSDAAGARTVTLPYFVTVVRGGNAVLTKRIGQATVSFADGEERAQASARAGAFVDASAATLPAEVRDRITRKRKAGDADAALDPLADPEVKAAIARATFEMLVGFQLDRQQLVYNATR